MERDRCMHTSPMLFSSYRFENRCSEHNAHKTAYQLNGRLDKFKIGNDHLSSDVSEQWIDCVSRVHSADGFPMTAGETKRTHRLELIIAQYSVFFNCCTKNSAKFPGNREFGTFL